MSSISYDNNAFCVSHAIHDRMQVIPPHTVLSEAGEGSSDSVSLNSVASDSVISDVGDRTGVSSSE